jgi:uncharacterized damage-inducible protein DinB
MQRLFVVLALCVFGTSALAQQASSAAGAAPLASKTSYDLVKGYITRAAEQMPEADYAFAPTPEVRTFGRLIGHIANANYALCANALGERSPSAENIEQQRTTKSALIEALGASFTYCDRAYAQTEREAAMPAQNFFTGASATRGTWLAFNAAHDFEHYGNIVTYMRLKGMVPPSSQPPGGNE